MRRILPVVGVVVLVLVLGFVVLGSCSGSSKADQYRSYVQDVNSVARQSNDRRQGARRRALQPGAHAEPGDARGSRASSRGRAPPRRRPRRSSRRARSSSRSSSATCCRRCSTARWRCRICRRRSRWRSPARPDTPPTEAQRTRRRQRLQRADRLRRRLRRELPAPRTGAAEGGERHRRADHGVGLEPLPRARQPGRQRQRRSGSSRCATPARRSRARTAPSAPRSTG